VENMGTSRRIFGKGNMPPKRISKNKKRKQMQLKQVKV
jgi:hypothetical protein